MVQDKNKKNRQDFHISFYKIKTGRREKWAAHFQQKL